MDTTWICRVLANPRLEVLPTANPDAVAAVLPSGVKVTVTCSPKFGVDKTVELACQLRQRGLLAVPHIAARGVAGPAHLQRIVQQLAEQGIDEVFVVGGDAERPVGEYATALELLEALASAARRPSSVGVAGYPEGHPSVAEEALMAALVAKQRYASYVTAQISFNPEAICRWLSRIRGAGVNLPVYLCLPGCIRWDRLVRIGLRLGLGASLRYLEKQRGLAGFLLTGGTLYDPWSTIQGLGEATCEGRDQVVGIHWSTFNEVAATWQWIHNKQRELQGVRA